MALAKPPVRDVVNHILFEISTEVAHRGKPRSSTLPRKLQLTSLLVGGIYSVIKSKARYTTAQYGARYTLLGPWNRASVCTPPKTPQAHCYSDA
jgi:glycogen(starch) synthase